MLRIAPINTAVTAPAIVLFWAVESLEVFRLTGTGRARDNDLLHSGSHTGIEEFHKCNWIQPASPDQFTSCGSGSEPVHLRLMERSQEEHGLHERGAEFRAGIGKWSRYNNLLSGC